MQTTVTIPHHDYPPSVRSTVEERISSLDKYFDRIVSMKAVLARESEEDHRVELVANVGHGVTLVVDSRRGMLNSAVDDAFHRMGQVLTRHKQKLLDRHRRHGRVGH